MLRCGCDKWFSNQVESTTTPGKVSIGVEVFSAGSMLEVIVFLSDQHGLIGVGTRNLKPVT
jgi:hypothetical protein